MRNQPELGFDPRFAGIAAEAVRDDDSDLDARLGATMAKVGESPSVLAASAKLQAMIDAARGAPKPLVDPRSLPVRFSRLKQFSLSPAHYLHSVQDDFEETLALRMGSAIHSGLFLNRPVLCYDGRRAGGDWVRFEKAGQEKNAVILNEKEYRVASGVIDAVRGHKRAMEILFDGTVVEERIDWSILDRACRSTPDSYRAGVHTTDLKSTRSAEPRWFGREALKRHYHAQLSSYDDAIEHKTSKRAGENYLVVVENVAPFCVVVFRLPEELRVRGAKLVRQWWEQLCAAESSGHYPGYTEVELELAVPDYEDHEPFTVEFDGKLITV